MRHNRLGSKRVFFSKQSSIAFQIDEDQFDNDTDLSLSFQIQTDDLHYLDVLHNFLVRLKCLNSKSFFLSQ